MSGHGNQDNDWLQGRQKEVSSLSEFSDGLRAISERREVERLEFNKKLGEPAAFIQDEENPDHGIGFWKAEGGVVSYRKYSNGYDPFTRHEYTDEFINILMRVHSMRLVAKG